MQYVFFSLGMLIFVCWANWSMTKYRELREKQYLVQFIGNILMIIFCIGAPLKISFFWNGQFFTMVFGLIFVESSIAYLMKYRQSGKVLTLVIFILLLAIAVWILIGIFYHGHLPSITL